MSDKRFDYIDHDLSREIENAMAETDSLDAAVCNQINSIKYFLKTEQHKITVSEPSVAAAEIQMKALAAVFNDRRDLLQTCADDIDKSVAVIQGLAAKLQKTNHTVKAAKLSESTSAISQHKIEIALLQEQLNDAKKEQLEELKRKILKAERIRHFKNLQ